MGTTVLIVEDDPGLRVALSRDLSRQGYLATFVSEPDDAIDVLTAANALQKEPFHVVLVDLVLESGWSGLDVIREAAQVSPSTRAILMSGFASAKDWDGARELGAVAVLSKPFSRADLAAAIERAVACREGLYGDVHGLSLADLLVACRHGRRSLAIQVSGPQKGTVLVRDGEVVDARGGGVEGEEALRLLLATDGQVRTAPLPAEITPTVSRDLDELLADLGS